MLAKLNLNLNEERNSLMSQVSCLLTQYHEILTQALEDKEHFHEKEKNNMLVLLIYFMIELVRTSSRGFNHIQCSLVVFFHL